VVPGPDPLGKRALFWMPVEPEADVVEDVPPIREEAHAPHRHANRHARPVGKHALFSDATPAGEDEEITWGVAAADPLPPHGLFTVSCSSCGSVTRIGLIELLRCQLPVPVWLPRRVFDRWMICPSCRRRTWASVTLTR
jgi:hypothetical protein